MSTTFPSPPLLTTVLSAVVQRPSTTTASSELISALINTTTISRVGGANVVGYFTNDTIAGIILSLLSFLASLLLGSTSLGDGFFLHITWGFLQGVAPQITTRTILGNGSNGDGMRMITLLIYVRMVVMTPYLLWKSWKRHMKDIEATAAAAAIKKQQQNKPKTPIKPASPTIPFPLDDFHNPKTNKNRVVTISNTLFWLLIIPSTFWTMIGINIMGRTTDLDLMYTYLGCVYVFFAIAHMTVKLLKEANPTTKAKYYPQLLIDFLRPNFLVPDCKDQTITKGAFFVFFLCSNAMGLLVTLEGIGTPPMMLLILLYEIPIGMMRYTFPMAAVITSWVRLSYAMYIGFIPSYLWPYFLPALVLGVIGLLIGVNLPNPLDPSLYSGLTVSLLILTGTVMIRTNPFITVPVFATCAVGLLLKSWYFKPTEFSLSSPVIANNPAVIVSLHKRIHMVADGGSFDGGGDDEKKQKNRDNNAHRRNETEKEKEKRIEREREKRLQEEKRRRKAEYKKMKHFIGFDSVNTNIVEEETEVGGGGATTTATCEKENNGNDAAAGNDDDKNISTSAVPPPPSSSSPTRSCFRHHRRDPQRARFQETHYIEDLNRKYVDETLEHSGDDDDHDEEDEEYDYCDIVEDDEDNDETDSQFDETEAMEIINFNQ